MRCQYDDLSLSVSEDVVERHAALASQIAAVKAERDAIRAEVGQLQAERESVAARLRAVGNAVPQWIASPIAAPARVDVKWEGTKSVTSYRSVALVTEDAIYAAMEREAKAVYPNMKPAAAMTEFMKTKRGKELYDAYSAVDIPGFVAPSSAA